MKTPWLSTALWAALLLSQVAVAAPGHVDAPLVGLAPEAVAAMPARDRGPSAGAQPGDASVALPRFFSADKYVWRGETQRTPDEIQAAGGMYARGVEKLLAGASVAPGDAEKGSSLFEHTMNAKGTREVTRYVSTSSDAAQAMMFATSHEDFCKSGYLYMIRIDAKMVDVPASLGAYYAFREQAEQAVVGVVQSDQIEGWYNMSKFGSCKNAFSDKVLSALRKGQRIPGLFEPNPRFDKAKYKSSKGSGAQPQLAGFPPDSAAWKDRKWSKFRLDRVSDNLDKFVRQKIARRNEGLWDWAKMLRLYGDACRWPSSQG